MKTLKLKSVLFSLLTVLAVSVFMTSCQQEEVIIDQIDTNSTELADRLADNANFQGIVNLLRQRQMDDNFIAQIKGYTTALGAEMPELIDLDLTTLEELVVVSSAELENTTVEVRCANGSAYDACAYGAWLSYFYAWYRCPTDGSDFGNCYATLNASLADAYAACFSAYC